MDRIIHMAIYKLGLLYPFPVYARMLKAVSACVIQFRYPQVVQGEMVITSAFILKFLPEKWNYLARKYSIFIKIICLIDERKLMHLWFNRCFLDQSFMKPPECTSQLKIAFWYLCWLPTGDSTLCINIASHRLLPTGSCTYCITTRLTKWNWDDLKMMITNHGHQIH